MPIYEYACQRCRYEFEELRSMGTDPEGCPECGGRIERRPSKFYSHYKGSRGDDRVRGESGKLARRVSETDLSHFEEGVRVDKKGGPHITPTRPPPLGANLT